MNIRVPLNAGSFLPCSGPFSFSEGLCFMELHSYLLNIIKMCHSRIENLYIMKRRKSTPVKLCTNFTISSAFMLSFYT